MPAKVLLIRGTARLQTVDGLAAEFVAAIKRYRGEEVGAAVVQQFSTLLTQTVKVMVPIPTRCLDWL